MKYNHSKEKCEIYGNSPTAIHHFLLFHELFVVLIIQGEAEAEAWRDACRSFSNFVFHLTNAILMIYWVWKEIARFH